MDYSELSASDERGAIRLVRVFQKCTRECVERYGGRVVKFLGDGAMVEFRSLQAAIAAADALRRSFAECLEDAGVGERAIRIGIHTGEIVEADGDVYGDGVNVAARIVDEAAPGEVLVSDEVQRQVRHETELEFEPLGQRELQGVGEVRLHRLKRVGKIEPETISSRSGLPGLWDEIQRRHVFRVAAAYVVLGVTVVQVVAAVFPALNLPEWSLTLAVVMTIVGFPIAIVLAWAFEWTPEGVRRSAPGGPAAKAGRVAVAGVAILAALTVGWYVLDYGLNRSSDSGSVERAGVVLDPSRLAVLYFDGRPESPETEALAAGFTESIIDQLTGIEELDVVSRYGVGRFRSANADIDSIAGALGAGTIVDGSVERAGDRVRIRVRLVDARDHSDIGAWTEERSMGDLFQLQEEVAEEIARNLRTRLGERLRLERGRQETNSVEAWELVQRAERLRDQAWEVVTSSPDVAVSLLADADELLDRAESLDTTWMEPRLLRAEVAARTGRPEAYERGLEHVRRVLDSEPRNPRARWLRGVLHDSLASSVSDSVEVARHLAQANVDLRFAVGVAPDLARAYISLADLLYLDLWKLSEARHRAEQAHREDPFLLEEDHFVWLCEISVQLKDLEVAKRWCAEGRRRYPDRVRLVLDELLILASPGEPPDPASAWSRVEELERLEHPDFNVPVGKMQVAAVLARAGQADSALAVSRRVRESASTDAELQAGLDYYEAYVRLHLDDRDTALDLLTSFLGLAPSYRAIVAREPWFESLTGDPRFERIVDRDRAPIYCRLLCRPPE